MTRNSQFPLDARRFLPHDGPMCCIERLLSSTGTTAAADVLLGPDHALLLGGELDPCAYVELAAQTAGAMQGYDQHVRGLSPKRGFLVGVQDFVIHAGARAGDRLRMDVAIYAELGEMTVLTATIQRDDELLAEGRLKVYVPE